MASNTLLDSTATFEMQASRAGLSDAWIQAFKTNAMGTLGQIAYAITTPGTSPGTDQITQFMDAMRPGVGATLGEITAVKRLVFEAQTLTIASLRSTVQSPEDSSARRLAPAERTARIEAQRLRLQGLELSGPLEPSYWLYDQFSSMLELGEIKYIAPNKCMTRQQEISGEKPEKQIKLDENKSSLVVRENPKDNEADVTTDLSLHQAMMRRALAMDLVGIATYGTVMRFVNRLFALMSQSPAPGFKGPGHAQLLRADRQAFMRLAELVPAPFHANAGGALPLDTAIDQLHHDVTVTYHMLPIPGGRAKDEDAKASTGNPNKTKKAQHKQQSSGSASKGGAKGSSKADGKRRQPLPAGLHGMHHKTSAGKPICFNYNLGKCSNKNCPREHVCCVPGCYKNHPQFEHEMQ